MLGGTTTWNLFRCLLNTFVAPLFEPALIAELLEFSLAATTCIGAIAIGVIGAAPMLIAGVAGVGMHPSLEGLHPLRYALVTVLRVWSSVTQASES